MENEIIWSYMWETFAWPIVRHLTIVQFDNARAAEEILWMNGATWAQLWSGAFGAIIGAGVAMHVLRSTLREQRVLAAKNEQVQTKVAASAAEAQSRLAAEQLGQQRSALETQLEEQRTALNLQLQEQRREASLNREHAAISELMAFLGTEIEGAFSASVPEHGSVGRLMGALARWQLESKDKALILELSSWLVTWGNLMQVVVAPERVNLSPMEARGLRVSVTTAMMAFARDWPHAAAKDKEGILKRLSSARDKVPDPEAVSGSADEEAVTLV